MTACPRCGQPAPIVYRGAEARCSGCGAIRAPFSAPALNLRGRPAQIGGSIARVVGWVVLFGGLSIAIMMLGILQAIFPAGFAGWAIGVPIAVLSVVVAIVLLRGGKQLHASGVTSERETREIAVLALAANRGGLLTAGDVAAAQRMTVDEADALLTDMATKRDDVRVDVDDVRGVVYRFGPAGPPAERVRVAPPRARVEDVEFEEIPASAREHVVERR